MHSFQTYWGKDMKSLLSVLFVAMLVVGLSLPNNTFAQNESPADMPTDPELMPEEPSDAMPGDDEQPPPVEMPADPELMPEEPSDAMPGDDEQPPPVEMPADPELLPEEPSDAMPGDDGQPPPLGEGEDNPNNNAAPIMSNEALPPEEE
jgi:hypothetical protein